MSFPLIPHANNQIPGRIAPFMGGTKVSERAANIKRSEILHIDRKVRSLVDAGEHVVKLHIGNVAMRTDERIIAKAHEAMLAGRTGYEGVGSCIPEFGEALVAYWKRRYGVSIERSWVITGPSIGLLNQTLDCLLGPGRTVGILTPAWEVYYSQVSETLAREVHVPMMYADGSWHVPEFSGDGMDLFLMNDPNNPTTSVLDEVDRQRILTGLSGTDATVISDLAYDNMYWDCDFRPMRSYEEIAERVVSIGSFSKSCRMAGWRMGYMISSDEGFLGVMRHKVRKDWTCTPPFIQYAAAYALSPEFEPFQREWAETVRRINRRCVDILESSGMRCVVPRGTIYVFADVGMDSVKFAGHLLESEHIATVPGKYFGANASNWVRMTTVSVPEEELYAAMESIGRAYQRSFGR